MLPSPRVIGSLGLLCDASMCGGVEHKCRFQRLMGSDPGLAESGMRLLARTLSDGPVRGIVFEVHPQGRCYGASSLRGV